MLDLNLCFASDLSTCSRRVVTAPVVDSAPIVVLAINDRNVAVESLLGPRGTPVPAVWSGKQIIELELPTGASAGVAHTITNRNQILGWAFFPGDFFDRALRWNHDGEAELLPLLSTDQIGSAVSGMSEQGLITGVTVNEDGSTVPMYGSTMSSSI